MSAWTWFQRVVTVALLLAWVYIGIFVGKLIHQLLTAWIDQTFSIVTGYVALVVSALCWLGDERRSWYRYRDHDKS